MGSKSLDEVKAEFKRRGVTVREWARQRCLSEKTVYAVLRGDNKGNYGQAHQVAVLLGLKHE